MKGEVEASTSEIQLAYQKLCDALSATFIARNKKSGKPKQGSAIQESANSEESPETVPSLSTGAGATDLTSIDLSTLHAAVEKAMRGLQLDGKNLTLDDMSA